MVAGPAVRTVSGVGPLDDVLAGQLGADAVRRLVLRPLDFGLAPLIEESMPQGRTRRLRLLRSKYKPRRNLTAYYSAYTATARGRAPEERHLAVTWQCAQTDVSREPPADTSGTHVSVLVYPDDPCLPALARLSSGTHLAALAADMPGAPGAHTSPLRVRVLRYRPGQRHVLRAVGHGDGGALIVKTDREDSGSRAVRVAQAHGPELERRFPRAGLARPLGHNVTDRASLWHESAGEPLWQALTARRSPDALVSYVGSALRVLHDIDIDGSTQTGHDGTALPRCRDADEHVALTRRAGEHISALLPTVGKVYVDLAAHLAERLDRLPAGPSGLAHGDLKCDHVIVDRDRLRLIDLDRAGVGDPAVDLGALLADLRWWCPGRAGRFAVALHAGYGPCEAERWTRAQTLAALFQLRFAARRCAVHDPAWERKVRKTVAAALGSVRERGLR